MTRAMRREHTSCRVGNGGGGLASLWHAGGPSLRFPGMKLPLFHRDRTIIKRADTQEQVEKLLAESLRLMGQVCTKVADLIETQRLERAGYAKQDPTLRRLDTPDAEPKKP